MENKNETHMCPVCGYRYEDKAWAERCEAWCREHKSCNLDIIAHGLPAAAGEALSNKTSV